MQKWKKSGSLPQLALNDSSDLRDTFMYRLSLTNGKVCHCVIHSYRITQEQFQYHGVEISITLRAYTLYNSH